jgi:hypothetical protein
MVRALAVEAERETPTAAASNRNRVRGVMEAPGRDFRGCQARSSYQEVGLEDRVFTTYDPIRPAGDPLR